MQTPKPDIFKNNLLWVHVNSTDCASAHSLTGFSVADYMKYLSYLLSLRTLTICIYKFYRHYIPNYYPILTHPVNFPCGRKPENPEKTHDFRQSVDELFPRTCTPLVVGGGRLDDWATEAPKRRGNAY